MTGFLEDLVRRIADRAAEILIDRLLGPVVPPEDVQDPGKPRVPRIPLRRPRKCPKCGKTFNGLRGVEVHIARIHGKGGE